VILGGTSLFGGEGSVWRTALGVLLLASLTNGLNLLGFDFFDQLIAQGIVIIIGTALTVRFGQERRS
jgi:ribose transport system permease protein